MYKVLITGATRGIGRALALEFAGRGCSIAFCARSEAAVSAFELLLRRDFSIDAFGFAVDLSSKNEVQQFGALATKRLGGLDILVNNAGIQHVANIEDFPSDRWDAIIAINLSSAFHTTRLALPDMQQKNWGRIINIASVHGLVASAGKSAYVAAKHGLIGLTKVTALENAHTGITCNAICPGWVLTPLVQKQVDARAAQENIPLEQAKKALLMEKQPSGEFVTPEDLGAMAVFLCSPAANQVRGAAWNMDGGWAAQ